MMGKQTNKTGSNFGGIGWTVEKLEIIDKYLDAFTGVFKKQDWAEKIYIDAFAGSGKAILQEGIEIEGSPAIALKYDFAKYYFIEYDKKRIDELKNYIKANFPNKVSKVTFIEGDCNAVLPNIFSELSQNKNVRGVMFLDPHALELKWEILEKAKSICIDIWYLFPMMSNRLLQKEKKISEEFKQKLNTLFGNEDWEEQLYHENAQINMFGEVEYIKEPVQELVKYVANKLRNLYGCDPRVKLFKNSKGSPLFLLCFTMTNQREKAKNVGGKIVSDIFAKIDKSKLE